MTDELKKLSEADADQWALVDYCLDKWDAFCAARDRCNQGDVLFAEEGDESAEIARAQYEYTHRNWRLSTNSAFETMAIITRAYRSGSLLPVERLEDGWRTDMENAPKDGEPFWLKNDRPEIYGETSSDEWIGWWDESNPMDPTLHFLDGEGGSEEWDQYFCGWEPTHWAPAVSPSLKGGRS